MVPPTLGEIMEDVLESVLEELEPNRQEPADVDIAEHEGLKHPAENMRNKELVEHDALDERRR